MQVRQQPAGTYNSQEHFVRVLPVFLVPATEWMLYIALRWVLLWVEARDKARKNSLQAKLKKMVNELKVSRHNIGDAPLAWCLFRSAQQRLLCCGNLFTCINNAHCRGVSQE